MASSPIGFNTALIPKLEGSINYDSWKVLVTSSLKASGVQKHISGTITLPITYEGEKEHTFQDRLEMHHTKMAQARNIILSTCKACIQMTLKDIENPQTFWDKLSAQYESKGLIHVQHLWTSFALSKFDNGSIEAFCAKYHASLDKWHAASTVTPEKIQVLQFIAILDAHYKHWGANKCEQMCRAPLVVPSLNTLMNETVDEWRRPSDKEEIIPHPSSFSTGLSSSFCTPNNSSRSPEYADHHLHYSFGAKKPGVDNFNCAPTCNYKHIQDKWWYKHPHLRCDSRGRHSI